MDKKVNDLNLSQEEKIYIDKICKKINILADNVQEYFANKKQISSDSIKDAYKVNNNLIEILDSNKELIDEITQYANDIQEKNKAIDIYDSLTIENNEKTTKQVEYTIKNKSQVIGIQEKSDLLSLRKKYINTRNASRLNDFNRALEVIEEKLNDPMIISPKSIKEDLELINNYFDIKEINKYNKLYLIPITIGVLSFILICVLIWIII